MSFTDDVEDATPDRKKPGPAVGSGNIDITDSGATVNNVVVTGPILTDWSPVFQLFHLDATQFEVVDDTVRMSTWQQSKRVSTGDRDSIQLYSYSARFRRITAHTIPHEVVNGWRAALQVRERTAPRAAIVDGGTYPILIADPQIGKKGTDEAVENWKRGVKAHVDEARRLGPAVERIHVGFMGDEFEGVANHYGNQAHTVELNKSRQLSLAYDLMVWTVREALTLKKPTSASSVISNHGEWTRNGSKDPVTTQHDNGSTFLAGQVKKLFDELAPFTKRTVDWTIGDTHPGITLDLSGVKTYMSHGYIEKGRGASSELRVRSAIEKQILGRTDDLGDVQVWIMAHYHHYWANTFSGRTVFGCPAIEAERSSAYMLDQYGEWSRPGVLGMLIGRNAGPDGWGHVNVW